MKNKEEYRRIQKNTEEYRNIFRDHWESFKQNNPSYSDERYDYLVQEMLARGGMI